MTPYQTRVVAALGFALLDVYVNRRRDRNVVSVDVDEYNALVQKHNYLADIVNRNQGVLELDEFDRIALRELYPKK